MTFETETETTLNETSVVDEASEAATDAAAIDASFDDLASRLIGGETDPEEQETIVEEDEGEVSEEADEGEGEEADPDGQTDDALEAQVLKLFEDDDAQYQIDDEVIDGQELKSRLLRQADYTKKTTELAEQRRSLEAELSTYADKLEYLGLTNQAALKKFDELDWGRLKTEDPALFEQARAEFQSVHERQQLLNGEYEQFMQQKQQQAQKEQQKQAAEALEVLKREIPEWSDDVYRHLKENVAPKYGITADVFAQQTSADLMRVLYDADKANRLEKRAKEVLQRKPQQSPKEKARNQTAKARQVKDRNQRMRSGDQAAVSEGFDAFAADLLKR